MNVNFFKNNPNFVWIKKPKYFGICGAKYYDANMQYFLQNVNTLLEQSKRPFFKDDLRGSTKIGTVEFNSKLYVIKRYNQKGLWHSFKKMFRQSRALRSWINSFYLATIGIATPQPVAVIINHFGPWRGTTYFITEFAPGIRGCDFFAAGKVATSEWPPIIANIVAMTAKLKAAHVIHDDYQYGNILVQGTTPLLLDLDHMHVYSRNSWLFRYRFRKDLQHFLNFLASNPVAHEAFVTAGFSPR